MKTIYLPLKKLLIEKMKKPGLILIAILFIITAFPQNWTEAVQINTLQGYNNNPDFYVASNGTIHCVWSYRLETNHRVIYYSKSTDDGITWSSPEDVSQNTSLWMENPHIVADSENNLHLTYDYNVYSPGSTLVVYKNFDGNSWSQYDTLSTGWYGSRSNKLIIDNNDMLYCFWFLGNLNGKTYYRTSQNNQWGDINTVYDNNDTYFFEKAVVDTNNVFHCTGYRHFEGQSPNEKEIVYSKFENGTWSELIEVSQDYEVWVGNDITLDLDLNPHIVWRQSVSNTIPPNDGTLYSKFDGINWSTPEIVVEDPSAQAIVIDKYNKVHIVDNEKYENGYRLVHYQKFNENWFGEIIEENSFGFACTKMEPNSSFIYMIYLIGDTVYSGQSETSVLYRKYEIITDIGGSDNIYFDSFKVYPNPAIQFVTIAYSLNKHAHTEIKIYDLYGNMIKVLLSDNQRKGKYNVVWDGTNNNDNQVKPGIYLVRLIAGRQIMTRSVVIN